MPGMRNSPCRLEAGTGEVLQPALQTHDLKCCPVMELSRTSIRRAARDSQGPASVLHLCRYES